MANNLFDDDDDFPPDNDPDDKEFLLEVTDFIQRRYKPVETFPEATIKMTTEEIFDQVQELCPGGYRQRDIFTLLKDAGFKYDSHPVELKFVWLMTAKKK